MRATAYILILALLGLAACTTQSTRRTTDINHIKAINKEARFRNVDVIWVNPPQSTLDSSINVTIRAEPDTEADTESEDIAADGED